jgi:hypothetical protein
MIDSDGSIYYNEASDQIFISISQKNKYLLDMLVPIYGGLVSPAYTGEAFKYVIFRKNEVLNIVDNYFSLFPLKSTKGIRSALIREVYILKGNRKDPEGTKSFHEWYTLKNK